MFGKIVPYIFLLYNYDIFYSCDINNNFIKDYPSCTILQKNQCDKIYSNYIFYHFDNGIKLHYYLDNKT